MIKPYNTYKIICFKKRKKGFTLVEVVVAIAILAIIVTSFVALFSSSFINVSSAGYKSEALNEAQEKMENAITDPTYTGSEAGEVERSSDTLGGIEGQKITVNIDYTDGNDNTKTVTISSFMPD